MEGARGRPPPTGAQAAGAPEDIAFDSAGNLFFSEFSGNRVDEITKAGAFRVVEGTGKAGYSGDGSPATRAKLNAPIRAMVDPQRTQRSSRRRASRSVQGVREDRRNCPRLR